jgi:hypothetical protein
MFESAYKTIVPVPVAYNFSNLYEVSERNENNETDESFDISDEGKEVEAAYEKLDLENMVVFILDNLDDRDKVIFLFQLLRDNGYHLTHETCAKTMHLNRQWYLDRLAMVRTKVKLYLYGKRQSEGK